VENHAKKIMNVKQTQHVINVSMEFVELPVAAPALLPHNAVPRKEHATTVWLVFAQQEDVELLVLSNLIVLVMAIALFAQQDMDVHQNVEDPVPKTLIVEVTSMDVDLVLIVFVFNHNVEQHVNLDQITLVIQLMDALSVTPLQIPLTLVPKVYPATLPVK